jgi:hypothetical protein
LVALVRLHDVGKCARGFQGKVLRLWSNFLGPKPDKELSIRHDAAGVWLFDRNGRDLEPGNRLVGKSEDGTDTMIEVRS